MTSQTKYELWMIIVWPLRVILRVMAFETLLIL
jgi:hypothetical protein